MNNDIIVMENISKQYKVVIKEKEGFLSSLKTLLKRKYEIVNAVTDVSLTIQKGEIRGLIGPNGAGKSTIIKMISGILYPSEGTISVMGYTPWDDRKNYVRNIGVMLGQKSQLLFDLPAIDTFYLQKQYYKIPEQKYKENLAYFKKLLNIENIINKPVRNLSLGERIKCELVCALLHEPSLVYLDEPTIGLDVNAKDAIRKFIKKVNKDKEMTFILTTHDLDDIENLCGKITIINKGTIVFNDSMERLKQYRPNKKRIYLKFKNIVNETQLAGYEVVSFSPVEAEIEIDLEKVSLQEVVAQLFKALPVQDINIDSIGIEEIIKQIYAQ